LKRKRNRSVKRNKYTNSMNYKERIAQAKSLEDLVGQRSIDRRHIKQRNKKSVKIIDGVLSPYVYH
ncbi:hypothetical protein, partial [Vibrio cholerae]|uniref:hypothetical protein n=1 Tax=Vibrio cholerae TaxID=666 RepID=UPI0022701752